MKVRAWGKYFALRSPSPGRVQPDLIAGCTADPITTKSDGPCILSRQLHPRKAALAGQCGQIAMQETEAEIESFGYTKGPKLR